VRTRRAGADFVEFIRECHHGAFRLLYDVEIGRERRTHLRRRCFLRSLFGARFAHPNRSGRRCRRVNDDVADEKVRRSIFSGRFDSAGNSGNRLSSFAEDVLLIVLLLVQPSSEPFQCVAERGICILDLSPTLAARYLSLALLPAAVNRISTIGQKFSATVKMNAASREPGLSQ